MTSSKDDTYYVTRAANNSYPIMQIHPWQSSSTATSKFRIGDGDATAPEYKIWLPLVLVPSIYYVSTTGNDANPGTKAQPWRTILKATKSLKSGDTATVLSGTYNEKVSISASGITLQADGKVITKGFTVTGNSNTVRGFTITDPSSEAGIFVRGGNYNLFEGNEIYHTAQDGMWFFGSYNTFRGNYIHNILDPSKPVTHTDCFQTWGWDWDTTNVLFEKNICINDAKNGSGQIVQLSRNTTAKVSDITFRNNILVLYSPSYSALNFWWNKGDLGVSNVTIVNNTIVNISQRRADGIYFDHITYATAINNLFINFGDADTPYIEYKGGSNINIHNNAVYNTDGIPPKGVSYPGDVWMQDPRVVNINKLDYHLQSNSPLIDAGYNLGNLVPDDFDGVIRPQGAGFDIGAYEFPAP
jgi:parallel beta-helix repeat protein